MFSCLYTSYARVSCPSQSEVWGFLYWGVCTCTSLLLGIPHLSSLLLPCFRPYAWLTCPSSSDMLNTTPPWNRQLQPSDLPGPVCFNMKLPPGSLHIPNAFIMQSCGDSPTPGCATPVRLVRGSSDLLTAGVGKAGCPGTALLSWLHLLWRSPLRVHVIYQKHLELLTILWPRRRRWAAMPPQFSEIQICDKSDFGVGGGGMLRGKHIQPLW